MTFKKLDDLPKDRPATYDEVMKAMAELHKGVMKQAALYGGKNSKLFIPAVVEHSLLKQVNGISAADLMEDSDEVGRLMDLVHERADELSAHLEDSDDKKGLSILWSMLRLLGAAIKANK